MRREWLERFPRIRLQRKPRPVSDPDVHHDTRDARAVMHVGIADLSGRENVLGIPSACATREFTYLERCPLNCFSVSLIYDLPRYN